MKVLLSEQGEADLLAIADRLGDTRIGRRFVDQFDRAVERLAMFPESGIPSEQFGDSGRFVVLGEFVLLYEVRHDSVWITAIVDGPTWRLHT
jgi:plasmid stabilization system protein ParE